MKNNYTTMDQCSMVYVSVDGFNSRAKVNERGFTIIEVLIAIVILSIGLLGLTKLQLSAINGNHSAMKFTNATSIAQEQVETLMATPFDDIADDTRTNADGYVITWSITNPDDLDGDGDNELITIIVAVDDPTGKRRAEISFIKAADI